MPSASSTASMTGTCGERVSGTSSSSGHFAVLGDAVRLVGGDQVDPPLRPPVGVHAGHQVVGVMVDQPVDEFEQPAHGVHRCAVGGLTESGTPK